MGETPVKIYIYDLSKGMARALSQMWLGKFARKLILVMWIFPNSLIFLTIYSSFSLIGKHLDGVWHTGVVAYSKEYFYGGMGIENCPPVSAKSFMLWICDA